jgi:16S rRNA G966 N2-methylase RsmD
LGTGEKLEALGAYFAQLAERLRGVRVACGDWTRVLGDSVTWRHGTTGIFLDPPYDDGAIDYSAGGRGISAEVAAWCREHGEDKRLRIALCGYEGDHEMPESWSIVKWKAHGGFSSQRSGDPNGNPHRERIWFSPGCVKVERRQLNWLESA